MMPKLVHGYGWSGAPLRGRSITGRWRTRKKTDKRAEIGFRPALRKST